MTGLRRGLWVLILSGLLLTGAEVRAEPAEDEVTAARERFEQAVEQFRGGAFEAALGHFRASFALNPLPQVLFNIGVTLYELRRPLEAIETLQRYLDQGDEEPEERLQTARSLAAELRAQLSALTVTCRPAEAELFIDGESRGSAPSARTIWLTPGRYSLEARQEGFSAQERALDLQAGQALDLELELAAERRPLHRQWWLWTIVGVVVVGAATGLALGLTRPEGADFEVVVERGGAR